MNLKSYPTFAIHDRSRSFNVSYREDLTCPTCKTKTIWRFVNHREDSSYCINCTKGIEEREGQRLVHKLRSTLEKVIKRYEERVKQEALEFPPIIDPISQLEL